MVPANFIWRYRANYCFPPKNYPAWDLKGVFARFYPTGWGFAKILEFLERHRPNFWNENNPHDALKLDNIKRNLIPLWDDVARQFKLDSLNQQQTMQFIDGELLPSNLPALGETIGQIGRRIVEKRFHTLVDDDKNYSYCAKPDCLLAYELDDKTFHILVQPDYIKRLRERRKSVKRQNIVVKRIIGGFKDSERKDLTDTQTAFGKSMLVDSWLLGQIGERFRWQQLTQVKLPNGAKRRVFLIPQDVSRPLPVTEIRMSLEILQEEGEKIFTLIPTVISEQVELAKNILDEALQISQEIRI